MVLAVIVVAIVAGVFLLMVSEPVSSPSLPDNGGVQGVDGGDQVPQVAPGQPSMLIVTHTDSGFSPRSITVKRGDTVVFKNGGSNDFWLGSDPHPLHNGYPTTGGCISSTFDSCMRVAPGQSFSFVFDVAGSWGYHNHLNPSQRGMAVVQ